MSEHGLICGGALNILLENTSYKTLVLYIIFEIIKIGIKFIL
jgi:hypothetical protein